MATLRYIACISENPETLTEFYRRFLGTDEIGRSPEGDISITDGFYNLTLFKKRPALGEMRMEPGLHHIGLEVDNLEEVKGRYLAINPRGMILQEPEDIHHGEIRIHDPECHPVSLSAQRFGVPEGKEKIVSAHPPHRLQRAGSGNDAALLHSSPGSARSTIELREAQTRARQPFL